MSTSLRNARIAVWIMCAAVLGCKKNGDSDMPRSGSSLIRQIITHSANIPRGSDTSIVTYNKDNTVAQVTSRSGTGTTYQYYSYSPNHTVIYTDQPGGGDDFIDSLVLDQGRVVAAYELFKGPNS